MAIFMGGDGSDIYVGTEGPDTIEGGRGYDTLSGGAGSDSITASPDSDLLSGGAGDDFFQISVCAVIAGGEGRDTFKFGPDRISWLFTPVGYSNYDLAAQTIITDFDLRPGGDVIDISGIFERDARVGPATYSTFAVNPFSTGEARLVDTTGGVQLQLLSDGAWKSMVLLQGLRADQLNASHFTPGTTDRTVLDAVNGSREHIIETVVIDPLDTPARRMIDGTAGGDTIDGSAQNDTVRGLEGDDTIHGLAGDDDLNGNQGADSVDGGAGADWVRGGQASDTITGGEGDDPHVNGNLGDDIVYGGNGSDTVYGGQAADTLYGEAGNDQLSGDLGFDILYGGEGADRFLFGAGQGRDWIMDFNGAEGDRIYLPRGQTYVVTSYLNQVMIEMDGGAGIGLQHIPESAFSRDWIVVV